MIYRTLETAKPDLDKTISGSFPFNDRDNIAVWAMDAVKFAYLNNIMKGTSATTISPLSNTNREQGVVLVKRTYEQYKTQQGQVNAETKAAPKGPIYSSSDYSSFVDVGGDKKCWFFYNLENINGISKVVYQVSAAPFVGFKEGWKNPIGLIKSGDLVLIKLLVFCLKRIHFIRDGFDFKFQIFNLVF
jgi:hypothetical protein